MKRDEDLDKDPREQRVVTIDKGHDEPIYKKPAEKNKKGAEEEK